MNAATQELLYDVTGQSLICDFEDGRPTSITSVAVYAADADDTSTAESATTGSAAVETNPNTTTTSGPHGPSNADPAHLTVTSGTGFTIGRWYRITEDGTGAYEDVEVAGVSGTTVYLRHPLKRDYSSRSTVQSCRASISVDATWIADLTNLSAAWSPNPTWRARWVYVLGGVTKVADRYFDVVRYPTRHGVTPLDVDRAFPGWLDRLPPDYQVDQGRALIDRAFDSLRFELYGDGKADQAIRNAELVARLVIVRAALQLQEDAVLRGAGNAEALDAATRMWRQIYDQTLRAPVAPVSEAGGGAAAPVRRTPAWRR